MAKRLRLNQRQSRVRLHPRPPTRPEATNRVALVEHIEHVAIAHLKTPPKPLRSCSHIQVKELAAIIREVGFVVPVVVDEDNRVWAGIVRLKAAAKLGMTKVPVVRLTDLSEAQKRAFRLADNKLAEKGKWNRKHLAIELPELAPLLVAEGLDISITGFSAVEIDQITVDLEDNSSDPTDEFDADLLRQAPVSRLGDVYRLGDHILCCGDARDESLIRRLVGNRLASMAFLDPPFNISVRDVMGRGRVKHDDFAMASGEMTNEEYRDFLRQALSAAAAASLGSAVHYVCSDWRQIGAVMRVGRRVYAKQLNLAVWVKTNAGQGSFYRSQHELIAIFRVGDDPHLNNIELGRHGRHRSNVWHYAGANTFRAGRLSDLQAHPTPKPTAMIVDAIKDCTRRDDTVLDTFCGGGSTLLAAERTGRRAVCVEIEPKFVDVAIKRWQDFTGQDAVHVGEDCTFLELKARRSRS